MWVMLKVVTITHLTELIWTMSVIRSDNNDDIFPRVMSVLSLQVFPEHQDHHRTVSVIEHALHAV